MTARDANTGAATALVDELVRGGVTDACVAPGSRLRRYSVSFAIRGDGTRAPAFDSTGGRGSPVLRV